MKKRAVSLILTVLMLLGICTTAFAFTYNINNTAVTQATLPTGIFLGDYLGDVSLVEDRYYFDRDFGYYVQSYRLSDASKLSLLIDCCMPIYNFRSQLEMLKDNNDVKRLKSTILYDQRVAIWDCLTSSTQRKITRDGMDATQALSYIKTCPEYQSNSTLQYYVNYHLTELLNGQEVRAIMTRIDPDRASDYKEWSPTLLIPAAEKMLNDSRVEDLVYELIYYRDKTTTPHALERNYTARQLSRYYSDLEDVAYYFYPDFIDQLDDFRFTVSQ